MKKASEGDKVKVHYTGTLEDGSTFDSSEGREPLEFTMGEGMMIPGFEKAVAGMAAGEKTTAKIPADEAYGPHRSEMVATIGIADFPESITPEVGLPVTMRHPDAGSFDAIVTAIEDDKVTLDANHPLAGKDLNFDIEVVEIG